MALGGHLATINDEQENQWIAERFGEVGDVSRALWIGLRDAGSQGVYTWICGEPLDFQFWWPGEPTDPTGEWNYVYITWPSVTRLRKSARRPLIRISRVTPRFTAPGKSRLVDAAKDWIHRALIFKGSWLLSVLVKLMANSYNSTHGQWAFPHLAF